MQRNILITFFICVNSVCFSQETSVRNNTLFLNGIYLENLKILLPWEINFSDFSKIGNPSCMKDPYHRNQVYVKWDSVSILEGIKVNLRVQIMRKFLCEDKSISILIFNFTTDLTGVKNLKKYFVEHTGKSGTILKGRKFNYTRWIISDRFVMTGKNKNGEYFLWVVRKSVASK